MIQFKSIQAGLLATAVLGISTNAVADVDAIVTDILLIGGPATDGVPVHVRVTLDNLGSSPLLLATSLYRPPLFLEAVEVLLTSDQGAVLDTDANGTGDVKFLIPDVGIGVDPTCAIPSSRGRLVLRKTTNLI